jgi:diguanylate cyclase (GGDEF)-like protein
MVQQDASVPLQPEAINMADSVVKYVHEVLGSAAASEELPAELCDVKKMQDLHAQLWGLRRLAFALSKGELEYLCKDRGFIVGSLKALQSNLRHLTWQAQCIARGEYHHRVSFLNDFSVAFNQMAEQLGHTINQLTHQSEQYKELSHRDPLTGLYNRSAFFQLAEQLLPKSTPPNATLIVADIDKFKSVNDTYGHLCGDEVLRMFANTLLTVLRANDLCCRYGGEEFLILMPGTPLDKGISIAERLRKTIEDMVIPFEKLELRVTASLGLSRLGTMMANQGFEDYLNVHIQIADDNVYRAKAAGRNRVIS